MINGNSLILQFGNEKSYGTLGTSERQIKVSSESFKPTYNKKDEGLLTGGKAAGRKETMSLKVDGSVSTLGRPDDLGMFLKAGLGVEKDVSAVGDSSYKHTFNAIGTAITDSLPSLCAYVDRKTDVFTYSGLKIDSFSFSAEPEDYLKLDLTFVGRDEGTGGTLGDLTTSPLKAFKFRHGKVKIAGVVVADITSIKWSYENALDSSTQTTDTGLYFKEPECGTRSIKTDVEMLYTKGTEELRKNYYKTDAEVSLELDFTSDELIEAGVPYSLKITIPANQVSEASANFGGAETIKQSMSFDAVENGTDELIIVELVNGRQEAY